MFLRETTFFVLEKRPPQRNSQHRIVQQKFLARKQKSSENKLNANDLGLVRPSIRFRRGPGNVRICYFSFVFTHLFSRALFQTRKNKQTPPQRNRIDYILTRVRDFTRSHDLIKSHQTQTCPFLTIETQNIVRKKRPIRFITFKSQ